MCARVLFVDDEPYYTDFFVKSLRAAGHEVEIARDIASAKRMIVSETPFDLAVLDLMLPPGEGEDPEASHRGFLSGIVLGKWIKSSYPNLKFICFSAYPDPQAVRWFEENGAGFFVKGGDPRPIADYVHFALGTGPKGRDELRAFIVHGHDTTAKYELKNFLQNSLNFQEPIILHEKASMGMTILEKFEHYAEQVDMVFVLLTPDDRVADPSQSNIEKRRARQNVIFEMGYFLGSLQRKKGRVILLYMGNLELPSDLAGLVYIDISEGVSASGEIIRKEVASYLHGRREEFSS